MVIRRTCLVALSAALVVLMSAPPVVSEPATVSLLNWVFDGEVRSAARLGQTLYVGGVFTRVAPSSNALPPVFAISTTTGQVTRTFPAVQGRVTHVIGDGTGGYFMAGDFVSVSPVRRHLVHVASDGTLDAAFDAQLTEPVRGVVQVGARLYFIGGLASSQVFAVSAVSGAPVAWQAPPLAPFAPVAIAAANDRVILAGTYSEPMVRSGLAVALDAVTGAELWRTVVAGGGVRSGGSAWAVVRDGVDVFVAHTPTSTNGGLSKLALASGVADVSWNPQISPDVVSVSGGRIYATDASPPAGVWPFSLAVIDRSTGTVVVRHSVLNGRATHVLPSASGSVFVAGAFSAVGAYGRHRLAEIDASGTATSWVADVVLDAVYALADAGSGELIVSSSVAAFGGTPRRNVAAFDLDSGALLPWNPVMPSTYGVSFIAASASRVVFTDGIGTLDVDPVSGADIHQFIQLWGPEVGVYADDTWVYTVSVNDCCTARVPHQLARYSLATGRRDESWWPDLPLPLAPARNAPPLAVTSDARHFYVAHAQAGMVALSVRTGRVAWANPSARLTHVAITGDTIVGTDGSDVWTFDARTGAAIATAPLASGIGALTVAAGRLVVSETDPFSFAGRRLAARTFAGGPTSWNPGIGRPYFSPAPDRFRTLGNVLAAGGAFGTRVPQALHGLAVFASDSASAPAALRARPNGPATEFAWDPPASAPSGGYVLEAGVSSGQTIAALPLGNVTRYSVVVPQGTFYARVRTVGAVGGTEEVSNEILVTGGCVAGPPPPANVAVTLLGASRDRATFSWTAPEAFVSSYTLVAGSAPGRADIASISLSGTATGLSSASAIPPGTYFVRVRAANACGQSAFSPDLRLTIGTGVDVPLAPLNLTATFPGAATRFTWTPPPGAITGYVLEAGSDVGLANLATLSLGPTPSFTVSSIPSGVYVLRVRAVNAAGTGAPSNDLVLRVP